MWYKKVLCTVLYIVIILLLIIFPRAAYTSEVSREKCGNTDGNLSNGGLAAEDDDWIYYSSGSGIWKIKKDGSGKMKISNEKGRYINVLGEWLYYVALSEEGKIYKIKTDGSERSKICNDSVIYMSMTEKAVYYVCRKTYKNGTNSSVTFGAYKMDTSGNNKTCIVHDSPAYIQSIHTDGKYIYYNTRYSITKANMDDLKKVSIIDNYVEKFIVSGDWSYSYCASLNPFSSRCGLYKVRSDGHNKSLIVKDLGSFNVSGDIIFYSKVQQQSVSGMSGNPISICRINTDGFHDTKIGDAHASEINVAGEWIFFKAYDSPDKLFKIKTDGSEYQMVE